MIYITGYSYDLDDFTPQTDVNKLDCLPLGLEFVNFHCPHCQLSYKPELLFSGFVDCHVYNVVLCPSCKKPYFVLAYDSSSLSNQIDASVYQIYPIPEFSSQENFAFIDTISERFNSIYAQSAKAESEGLTELAGMGYRKALEFLVRDFCIYKNPEKAEDIQKVTLSQCINKYLENTQASTLARASAWIGNDETHYIRQHVDKDIKDLKNYLKAFITFIECELQFQDAFEFVNRPKS